MDEETFIEIQRLFKLMHERGLKELAITQPGFTVRATALPGGGIVVTPAPVVAVAAAPVASAATAAPAEPAAPAGYVIPSPLVGTFYRAATPDAPPFVEVGDTVEAGQTIGIVEAMKVFNEITADVNGTVIAIPAANGKLVQEGQPLVVLETL
jgi:acetyl-CoA carboxylase biotin carboxyl carrier protein